MSFWESELGDVTGKAEDAFARQFKKIPDGTKALAKIESFCNDSYKDTGTKFLTIDWLLQDGEFKGQKVQQKIKVYDNDPKVRQRALNMLKLLYQLFNVKPKATPPTDEDLGAFVGRIGGIKIRETEPNDNGRSYNWVPEVYASAGFKCETGVGLPIIAQTAISSNSTPPVYDLNDVPF